MSHRCGMFFLILLALWTASCQPPGRRAVARRSSRIINGTPDTNPAHYAVVDLDFFTGTDEWLCSGTLIGPDVVMTAGHCCFGSSTAGYTVSFGPDDQHFTASRTVSVMLLHPGYDDNTLDNDICLLRLGSAAPPGIQPLPPLPASLKLTNADVGAQLEFVGYGDTNGVTQTGGGTKMTVTITNALEVVCESAATCDFDNGGNANDHTIGYSEAKGGICEGDSGGPALITRNGKQYVAGATSYGDMDCQVWAVSTTVDDYEGFIGDFMGGANGIACTDPGQCQSGNCVGGVCCDSPCTGPCKACGISGFVGSCHQEADSTPCPDGNKCNGDEICQGGACIAGTPLTCTDNPCQVGSCDPLRGCVLTQVANGTSCSDDNLCNGFETCQNGNCLPGQPPDCNDDNPCTTDSCDPIAGCTHDPLADGKDCGGGVCGQASCKGGQCQYADPAVCDDHDPCTSDWCDPQNGCGHKWLPEGYTCGKCKACQAHVCVDAPDCKTGSSGCATPGETGEGGWLLVIVVLLLMLRRKSVIPSSQF